MVLFDLLKKDMKHIEERKYLKSKIQIEEERTANMKKRNNKIRNELIEAEDLSCNAETLDFDFIARTVLVKDAEVTLIMRRYLFYNVK